MLKNQTNIKEFMTMAGQNVPNSLTTADEATRRLRIKLILEELVELAEASGFVIAVEKDHVSDICAIINKDLSNVYIESNGKEANIVEMADAITDIDYVNTGAAVAYGMDLEPLHDEVHRSNMSKLWTEEEVNALSQSSEKNDYTIKLLKPESDRKYGVFQNGKLKKSPSYSKANLEKVLKL